MAARRKRVTFKATKRAIKTMKVAFRTSSGKRVSFVARRQFPKRETVTFYVRKTGRRRT